MYTKRLFSAIVVFLEVVIKNEIVKFSKNCGTFAIKKSGGVKVQIMEFQKDNNNNKLPKWFREASKILYISDDETDCAVKFISRNLVTQKSFVEFRDSRNILRISRRRV